MRRHRTRNLLVGPIRKAQAVSETVSLEWIGATLRAIQAEQRSIRLESGLLQSALTAAVTALLQRIGEFEAHMDTRFDEFEQRIMGAAP